MVFPSGFLHTHPAYQNYLICDNGLSAILFFQLDKHVISFAYALPGIQIKHLIPEEEIPTRPKKATLYGIDGQRVEPTEHEVAVTQG